MSIRRYCEESGTFARSAIDANRPLSCPEAEPILRNDAGFVQLLVLAALATLGGLFTAALMTATYTSRQTAALERLVRSDAIAESGFQRLTAAIDESSDVLENQALQGFVSLPLASAEILLGIEADGSKIDVLTADPLMLERYLAQAGLDPSRVTILLADIGEARSRSDGAGALEIVRAAIAGLLPTGAFDRDLTRFGSLGIDPTYASARVLHAIPDLASSDADRIATTPAGERAQYARLSRYFASTGRRFSLVTHVGWGADAAAEQRLPIEISTSGKVVVLAGPS